MHNRLEAVLGSVKALLWPLLALIPMNILAIWLGVRSAMAPVRRLSGDIAARGSENLAPIDVSDQPRELKPIADAVARLVERLRVALDAERAFSANSAHELRTPIAGALAQTQRLIAELDDAAAPQAREGRRGDLEEAFAPLREASPAVARRRGHQPQRRGDRPAAGARRRRGGRFRAPVPTEGHFLS